MKEILLSSGTNDIVIENGDIKLATANIDSLRQRIYITLNAWAGEWKLNVNFGMPYRQSIFVTGIDKASVDALFLRQINRFDEVISIQQFESELDKINRKYTITRLIVTTEEGTESIVSPFVPDENTTYQASPISEAGNICIDL